MRNDGKSFERLFKPRTVLIYKLSPRISFFIEGFIRQGFDLENLYLVNSKADEFLGIKCYKSIEDVPIETFDLLILSVRRDLLVESLTDILSEKKIRFIHIFTAGTGEFDDEGIKIERKIRQILKVTPGTRSIGPNCMGLYCPQGKIAYYSSFPPEKGNIALIFQSGDLHSKMVKIGSRRRKLRFSKGVSIGNCIDIQISELLEYLNNDIETDVICVYFEGLPALYKNEGKRLLHVLRNMRKPVLFMRGGRTKRGQAAVLTHTGSLATNDVIWRAIFNQTPIIEVPSSLDELIDYTFLFSKHIQKFKKLNREVKYPKGKNAIVILWSGGFGILATDILTELGFNLPLFEGEKLEKLKEKYPIKIGSLANPLDLPWVGSSELYLNVSKAVIDDNIDFIMIVTDAWRDLEGDRFKNYYRNIIGIKSHVESLDKTFVLVLPDYPSESRQKFQDKLVEDGFLVYSSIERAAKSFLKLFEYGKKRKVNL
ncbi:MAG: CoA-binding protein [Promethearchaeota archaeon]|jgi:acetyl-CoA synthetase (ADP-forming)